MVQSEKRRRGGEKIPLVSISLLALSCVPYQQAFGAIDIVCKAASNFAFGSHIACGDGSLTIQPNGVAVTNGCLIVQIAPQAAQCTVRSVGGKTTRSAQVTFAATTAKAIAGANAVTLDNFKMQIQGKVSSASQMTLSPAQVNSTVILDVGATVHFSDRQPKGTYTGAIVVRANPL